MENDPFKARIPPDVLRQSLMDCSSPQRP